MIGEVPVRMTVRVAAFAGDTPRAVEQASRCWAEMMARCTADNEKDFTRADWNFMAEAHGGPKAAVWSPRMPHLAEALADRLLRAHGERELGDKWFGPEPEAAVHRLFLKVCRLDEPHAWAVVTTIEWFWDHYRQIEVRTDPWWTEPYRMAIAEGRPPPRGEGSSRGEPPPEPGSDRRKRLS